MRTNSLQTIAAIIALSATTIAKTQKNNKQQTIQFAANIHHHGRLNLEVKQIVQTYNKLKSSPQNKILQSKYIAIFPKRYYDYIHIFGWYGPGHQNIPGPLSGAITVAPVEGITQYAIRGTGDYDYIKALYDTTKSNNNDNVERVGSILINLSSNADDPLLMGAINLLQTYTINIITAHPNRAALIMHKMSHKKLLNMIEFLTEEGTNRGFGGPSDYEKMVWSLENNKHYNLAELFRKAVGDKLNVWK